MSLPIATSLPGPDAVEAVRRFTRFYTKRLGVLRKTLLDSPFSLAEARVLYELAHHETTTAKELAAELDLDPGYLSRILQRFRKGGIIAAKPEPDDRRQTRLSLTEAGQRAFATINARSRAQIRALLDPLAPADRERLTEAMDTIERCLAAPAPRRAPFILRPHQPGDMGWIVSRHGALYAREYGWDETFEALVAEIAAQFLRAFDPKRERCWLAEMNGATVGSVMVVRKSDAVAQLRLLLVEAQARGCGIGQRLVEECVRFARQTGYERITLWTNDNLHAAIHLYVQAGFRLVREEPHHSFGCDLVGQHWELDLQNAA